MMQEEVQCPVLILRENSKQQACRKEEILAAHPPQTPPPSSDQSTPLASVVSRPWISLPVHFCVFLLSPWVNLSCPWCPLSYSLDLTIGDQSPAKSSALHLAVFNRFSFLSMLPIHCMHPLHFCPFNISASECRHGLISKNRNLTHLESKVHN